MKYLMILISICVMSNSLIAQSGRQEKEEMIKAQKVAYITSQLELTVDEAQKFWPLYNEYNEKKDALHGDRPDRNVDLTEAEAKEMLSKRMDVMDKEFTLRKDYLKKLQTVLPAKKVLKLISLDGEFKRNLLKKFKSRQEGKNKEKSKMKE